MMVTEELKRSLINEPIVEIDRVLEWQRELDSIAQKLDFLLRLTLDSPGDDVRNDIYLHCAQRAVDAAVLVLKHVTTCSSETNEVPDLEPPMEGQAAIARIAELNVVLHGMWMQQQREKDDQQISIVIESYTSYQRQVLRQRSKPPIAQLATWRKSQHHVPHNSGDDDDVDDEEEEQIKQPHIHAMTVILGQASALLHPLLLWIQQVPSETPLADMCKSAVVILDDQAQTLTKTICTWFHEDKKIEEWMSKTTDTNDAGEERSIDLAELDALLEEMSFACQVLARYDLLIRQTDQPCQTIVSQELLPEWTWRYASLERFLSIRQWRYALKMACPVEIVMGTSIKVPSVVEDAQYLSTRALERASSTMSIQAMGTVAHAVTHDVWSTDDGIGGVHHALLRQLGCWAQPEEKDETPVDKVASPPVSNSFASALLGALDDDADSNKKTTESSTGSRPPKSPSSGGLLGGIVGSLAGGQEQKLMKIHTQQCNLNGIHSASVACSSLEALLENLLENNAVQEASEGTQSSGSAMIELAREELMGYDKAYQELLFNTVRQFLLEWCMSRGQCLHLLREFLSNERYELDPASFRHAELEDRLERDMMAPLRRSPVLCDLDRCDTHVATQVARELSSVVSHLILELLWDKQEQPQGGAVAHPKVGSFNDWGALLLSKQVRLLSQFMVGLVESSSTDNEQSQYHNTAVVTEQWEQLSEVVTLLQLEKPSDFSAYQGTCGLTVQELEKTLSLRVDFSKDAILATTQSYSKSKET